MKKIEYPEELFFKIKENKSMVVRVTVNLGTGERKFWGDIDLVQKESGKIVGHIGKITNKLDREEVFYGAMSLLRGQKY